MTRGILIAGNESPLFSAIAAEASRRVESFACALIANRFALSGGRAAEPSKVENLKGAVYLSWNQGSPLSTRTMVMTAENRLETINDAILVCSPPALYRTAGSLLPEEVEILVNDQIKGWFFLLRELALYFRRKGAGALSFVLPDAGPEAGREVSGVSNTRSKNAQADLPGKTAAASFHALAQGVLSSSANEPFLTMGFGGAETRNYAEFAAWLFKIIDEGAVKNSGAWHKYSKFRLFR